MSCPRLSKDHSLVHCSYNIYMLGRMKKNTDVKVTSFMQTSLISEDHNLVN